MPEKSPESFSIITYCWVFGLAMLGGVVSFARKVREGHSRAWNFAEFLGEIVTSALAGLITFYLCEWSGFSQLLTAALVGISGHMGSRAIFQLEGLFDSKFPKKQKENL